jgi:hypothetical protein
MVTYRPATTEDIRHFANGKKYHTMRAWVIEKDDERIGLGGFSVVSDRWYLFFEITDELRKHKTFLVKAGLRLIQKAKDQGIKYLYCDIDWCEPTAYNFVTFLGFELDPRSKQHYRLKFGDT